jgi:hypothetical protein
MTEPVLEDRVRALRAQGRSPKEIARALGTRPDVVTPIVRQLAAEQDAQAGDFALVGCWVNEGWDGGLAVDGHPEWPRGGHQADRSGLVTVVVARRDQGMRVSACAILVDTWCLGAKGAVEPQTMSRTKLADFRHGAYGSVEVPLEVPLELAQHLVFGAVDYARTLGVEPHRDYAACVRHLGTWTGPSAITFGRDGRPTYIAGPYDHPARIVRTLERSVGKDGFSFVSQLFA